MRFSSTLLFLIGTAAPVGATCFVCDELVELTEETAACFEERYEKLVEKLQKTPSGRQSVDIGACTGVEEAARRDGLILMGELPSDQDRRMKTVFIFDMASAVCLKNALTEFEGDFDPSHRFDLVELCDEE